MNEHTTVSAKQLCTLVFLSLAVDMAVRPFTSGGSAGAQIAILAAVLNTAVVSILLLPVLGLLRREAFTTLKGGVTFGSKALLTLSAVLFAAGGAAAMVRSEALFRYVSDEPMPQLLVYGLFLLVVFYALRCGLEGIVRVLGLAAGLFLLSMALMLVSNLGGMHLSNLTFQPFDFPEVLRTAARGFTLPPEFLLFIESPLMFWFSASGGFLSVVRFFIGAVRLIQAEKRFFAGERYFVQLRVRPTRVLSFSRSCSAFTGCGASS